MDKLSLESIFEKYHLGGLIEKARLNIKDNNIEIKFVNEDKNLTGIITSQFEFQDCEIGIYDTTQFLKLISILNRFIVLKPDEKNGIIQKLLIADDEYNLEYPLANINIIPKPPSIEEPLYEVDFEITKEFISKFLKAYKVLKIDTLLVNTYIDDEHNNKIKFVIGEDSNFSNKIDFSILGNIGIPGIEIKFPIKEFASILNDNSDLKTGKGYINPEGILKMEFETEKNVKSTYFLIGKE